MPAIEIRFTPRGEDAVHAARAAATRSWTLYLLILLLALMFLVGVFLIDHGYSLAGWLWLAVSALMFIAAYQVPLLQARRTLVTNPSAQGEIILKIDETRVAATFPTGNSYVEWRAFSKYRETTHLFVLFYLLHRSTFIPKRVMSPQQIAGLRVLLNDKIIRSTG